MHKTLQAHFNGDLIGSVQRLRDGYHLMLTTRRGASGVADEVVVFQRTMKGTELLSLRDLIDEAITELALPT